MEKPAADARTLRLFALLDSPRVSGAYQFDVAPGDETVVEVRARLYLALRSARSGSHRSRACFNSVKTSRTASTSAPRCTIPTA